MWILKGAPLIRGRPLFEARRLLEKIRYMQSQAGSTDMDSVFKIKNRDTRMCFSRAWFGLA